jgi:hypothetical protein
VYVFVTTVVQLTLSIVYAKCYRYFLTCVRPLINLFKVFY